MQGVVGEQSGLLFAELLVDHGPEVREDLVFSLVPLLTVEHCQGSPEKREGCHHVTACRQKLYIIEHNNYTMG